MKPLLFIALFTNFYLKIQWKNFSPLQLKVFIKVVLLMRFVFFDQIIF